MKFTILAGKQKKSVLGKTKFYGFSGKIDFAILTENMIFG